MKNKLFILISSIILILLAIAFGSRFSDVEVTDLRYGMEEVTKKSILADHQKINNPKCGNKRATMAQISATYQNGYDLTLKTPHAMTHISPQWFDVNLEMTETDGKREVEVKILGHEYVNTAWMEAMRKANPDIKIVPEFRFRKLEEAGQVLRDSGHIQRISRRLYDYCLGLNVDGLVLDGHQLFFNLTEVDAIFYDGLEAMAYLGSLLKKEGLVVIGAIQPADKMDESPEGFQKTLENETSTKDCEILTSSFDYVLLKTNEDRHFDSQLSDWQTWVHKSTQCFEEKEKLMLGVNFYGFEYNVLDMENNDFIAKSLVDAPRFLEVLEMDGMDLEYHDSMKGHLLLSQTSGIVVAYPTLTSVEYRLTIARKNKMSVAISNYGMGLNYFANLLDAKNQTIHEMSISNHYVNIDRYVNIELYESLKLILRNIVM